MTRGELRALLLCLNPVSPHMTEEMWEICGFGEPIYTQSWPTYDENKLVADEVEIAVQIKGKVRGKLEVSPDIDPKELEKMALEAVADRLGGKEPRKVIVKAPKIVSIVPAE